MTTQTTNNDAEFNAYQRAGIAHNDAYRARLAAQAKHLAGKMTDADFLAVAAAEQAALAVYDAAEAAFTATLDPAAGEFYAGDRA